MTISGYLRVLRSRWRTVVVIVVATFAAALGVTELMPKTYVADATMFVSISGSSKADGQTDSLYQNSQYALSQVQSYPAMVTSPAVLRPVIDELGLNLTVRQLKERIVATNPVETVLLDIRVSDTSARQARTIANSVANHLGDYIEGLEAPATGQSSPVKVTTAVPAALPAAPSSPRLWLNLALGLLLGLALGIVVAALRERLDTTVKTLNHLRELTGANPLGAIRHDKEITKNPLILAMSDSHTIEDFRSIRTNLRYVDVDQESPTQLVISSAVAGEGKSVLTLTMAIVMAQMGLNVCVVEADLRRPHATRYLGIDGSVGLTEVSAGEIDIDEALVSWNRGTLTVLPSGSTPPDPAHLLGSHATSLVLEKLRSRFDLVIIDAPPLLPVSDAAILGRMSDGVILVARHGVVDRVQVANAIETLDAVGARLVGTVLNATPSKDRKAYYGHDYAATVPPALPMEEPLGGAHREISPSTRRQLASVKRR